MKNRQTFIFIPTEKRGFVKGLAGVFVFMFLYNGNLSAANLRDVVINEIAWMGTAASTYDEWIELYNNTGSTVNLSNWILAPADGTPSVTLSGSIAPYGYFLLERTDDNTVSDITADQIFSGSIENGDEDFQLKDSSDTLIDQVDCSAGWFAGDSANKITMERMNPAVDGSTSTNWANNDEVTTNGLDANSNPLKGTARALNSVFDDISPSEVTDVAAFPGIGEGEINLSWTATGDDGTVGTASAYIVRYNVVEISTANWAASTAVTQSWTPQASGNIEWHVVTGLTSGTTYYFAVKAKDEAGNSSGISNSPFATGQYSDAVVFNEVAPSETGGGDIIEIYVKKQANCANANIYENANAQGAELIKTLPASGDWTGNLPAGTYIVIRTNNTSSDETDIGVDGVLNVYSTDSGLTATDNLLFIGNIEGIVFSAGAYQSGVIIDFIAWANQDNTDLTDDYKEGVDAAVSANQWAKTASEPVQFDCVNSRGCYTYSRALSRDQYSTDEDSKSDWSYRTSLSIGSVNSPPTTYPGQGSASIDPAGTVITNATGTWTITYNSADPNSDNTCHMLTFEIPADWTSPQTTAQYSAGYTTTTYSFASGYGLTVAGNLIIAPVGNMTNGESIDIEYKNASVQADTGTVVFVVSSDEVGTNVGELTSGSPSLVVSDDTTPPSAITDLAAESGTEEGAVSLTWTAPGDDGMEGQATAYIVRYSSADIIDTDAKFNSADDYANNWTPLTAGSQENRAITGLVPATTYWIAIKTQDEIPNASALSNSPSAIAYNVAPSSPTGLSAQTSYQTVSLSWNVNTELDLSGYNVYRTTESGTNYVKLNGSLLTSTTHQDANVTAGTTYFYVATAVDNTDLESAYSAEVSLIPPNLIPPDGAIVISEIMYDPNGIEPNEEWIEICNISSSTVDLSSCTFTDGEGTYTIPNNTHLDSNMYFVLAFSSDAAGGNIDLVYGSITGEALSLANSEDDVIIRNKYGVGVDTVTYSSDWGADNGTGANNFTLQRKDLYAESQDFTNWGKSLDQGGTPQAANNTDSVPPVIDHTAISTTYVDKPVHIYAGVTDNQSWYSGDVKLYYRKTGGTTNYTEIQMSGIYDTYSGSIPSEDVTYDGLDYYIRARDDYNNIVTEPLTGAATSPLQIMVIPCPYRLVINEIMFDPSGPEPADEWVEVYNDTSSAVDISSWTFSDLDANYVIPDDTIIPGYGYFVFGYSSSAANGNVDLAYGLDSEGQYIVLNNSLAGVSDSVIIKNTDGLIVDEVPYASSWGAHNVTGPNNNTLERLVPSGASEQQGNWLHSNIKAGTPRAKNSSHMVRNVSITPEIFNPSRGSTATITYDLVWEYDMDYSTTTVEVKIYDSSGTLIRTYTDTKSSSGTYSQIWDGKNESEEIVLGINTVDIVGSNGSVICTHDSDDRTWFDYGANLQYMGPVFQRKNGEVAMYTSPLSKPVIINVKVEDENRNFVRNLLVAQIRTGTLLTIWDGRNFLGQLVNLRNVHYIDNIFETKPEGHILATIDNPYCYNVYVSSRTAFNPEENETRVLYYSLSFSAFVNIKVYNNDSGEFIETLVDENKSVGSHSLIWDGKDNNGSSYADGIYIFVITLAEQSLSEEVSIRNY